MYRSPHCPGSALIVRWRCVVAGLPSRVLAYSGAPAADSLPYYPKVAQSKAIFLHCRIAADTHAASRGRKTKRRDRPFSTISVILERPRPASQMSAIGSHSGRFWPDRRSSVACRDLISAKKQSHSGISKPVAGAQPTSWTTQSEFAKWASFKATYVGRSEFLKPRKPNCHHADARKVLLSGRRDYCE